jgi:hypothetical protein
MGDGDLEGARYESILLSGHLIDLPLDGGHGLEVSSDDGFVGSAFFCSRPDLGAESLLLPLPPA